MMFRRIDVYLKEIIDKTYPLYSKYSTRPTILKPLNLLKGNQKEKGLNLLFSAI